ncbi:peptidoglycan DD-metalloendopeptidase family protein [Candidatus Falkowbacteria bacterium]|nr:peptidoglycan DD-metalloendopeptidase family protein [Candidatus Falkowbacteria bacterium]
MLKSLIIFKNLLLYFYKNVLARPGRWVLRLFFYKVAVKIYQRYFILMRRLGWNNSRTSLFSFLFDQKLVHVVVGLVTISIVFVNLTSDTKAQDIQDPSGKTILSTLISSEFGTAEEDQLIVETFDREKTITPTQQKYLDNLSSVKSEPIADLSEPEGSLDAPLDINDVDDGDSLNNDLVFTNPVKKDRSEIVSYTVEQGDTISTIAKKFDIGVNTILWQNNLNAYSVIRPGDVLSILPVSGVVHAVVSGETVKAIASKYDIPESTIADFNKLSASGFLTIGQKLIIPGGRKESYIQEKPKSYSGLALLKNLVTPKKDNKQPSNIKVDASDDKNVPDDAKPTKGNKMAWPTSGYRITQYYSWKHFAIDVADKVGTPIYAADAGVIESAGWGRGYGNNIVINHGGGKKTRYAHLSKFYVKAGGQVDKGQTIAAMGNTGWSTGPHLHFEIIINGTKYNPLNYVR